MDVATDSNGFYVITWDSVGGKGYRVQYTDDVIAGNYADVPGSPEDTNAAGFFGTTWFTDDFALTGTPSTSGRYYRVRLAP